MKTKTELSNPYLIQRLKKPYKIDKEEGKENLMASLANAFSFGGGLPQGGMTKESWSVVKDIWRYDYMGSSEFEFGAVPKSLHEIGELRIKNKLTAFEFTVTGKLSSFSYENEKSRNRKADKFKEVTVYVICDKDYIDEIKQFIINMADGIKHIYPTKESVNLHLSICGCEYYLDTVGWHDLDNNYMFFTDKEMFYKISVVLGLNNNE